MQRHRAFKRRLWWQHPNILQNVVIEIRDGIVGAEAEREVEIVALKRPVVPCVKLKISD